MVLGLTNGKSLVKQKIVAIVAFLPLSLIFIAFIVQKILERLISTTDLLISCRTLELTLIQHSYKVSACFKLKRTKYVRGYTPFEDLQPQFLPSYTH